MPNWCNNQLTITSNEQFPAGIFEMSEFVEKYCSVDEESVSRGSPGIYLDFNKVVCKPTFAEEPDFEITDIGNVEAFKLRCEEVQTQNIKNHGYKDWHDWTIANWGTQWNSNPVSFHRTDDSLYFCFDTAWCPPYKIIEKLIADNPRLVFDFSYEEYGNFQGTIQGEAGLVIENREWEHEGDDEEDEDDLEDTCTD